jgi:DNA invertase Pin-like site-specific DNA recombinase
MANGKFISYLRVSTQRQGRSGLGLEAQRRAVEDFLNGGRWTVIREFVEVESGKRDDRPQLAEALQLCKLTGAKLVIAKLDRLSRDAHFLLGLQKAGVPFVAADMPEANEMVVGIMAVMAQHERKMISERTKAALGSIRRRLAAGETYVSRSGRKIDRLGNPNGAQHLIGLGNSAAVGRVRDNADQRATNLKPVIDDIRAAGITSVRGICAELNARGILTPRQGNWHPTSVARLLDRLAQRQ